MTKVFVVNDTFDLLQSLSRWFTGKGCYVRTFSKPEPLLDALHESLPDVIVMNADLPDEKNCKLFGQIKDEFAGKIPVILFSSAAHTLKEIKNNCEAHFMAPHYTLQKEAYSLN